jgi:16S rRNA C967 or C1407 C5-methylase (RsmB/RsmF family)
MASVRELLVREVERLSEEDAREVLELLKRKQATGIRLQKPKLTREDLIKRFAGHAGIHVPDPEATPFEKLERIATRDIRASQLLIADRR